MTAVQILMPPKLIPVFLGPARKAGAFGGTGAAVAASLGNETFARQAAQTAAELRSRGYESALAAAQADAGRSLEAERANQQADLSVASSNAGFANTANLENMRALNQRAEYNASLDQQSRLADADAANRAALANAQSRLVILAGTRCVVEKVSAEVAKGGEVTLDYKCQRGVSAPYISFGKDCSKAFASADLATYTLTRSPR
jgi:hypothetical protein